MRIHPSILALVFATAAAAQATPEPALTTLTRTAPDAISLQLTPGKSLAIHDFDFNGDPVPAAKIHLRQLSPGVFELTSLAYAPGIWRFHLTDQASYFGLGEHFNTLDHAHTILRNRAITLPSESRTPRGSTSPRPVPFFLSTTGYALYLDLPPDPANPARPSDATFDLNASDPAEITIDASTTRLRILLFTGPAAPTGSEVTTARFPDLLTQFLAAVPAPNAAPAANPSGLGTQLTAILSAGLSGLPPAPVVASGSPWDAPAARYLELAALTATPLSCPQSGVDPALCTRYQALSRLLASSREAAATLHQPILRPLALDFQDDPEARDLNDEFLVAPGLLAAPVRDINLSRPVYLPAGEWRNLASGEKFTGPTHILVAAPLDTIPLFVRAGSTLPDSLEHFMQPLQDDQPTP